MMAASSKSIAVQPKSDQSARRINMRTVHDVLLIWLDADINESNIDCQNTITRLRRVISTINIFTDANECVNFLTEVPDRKVCMLVSGSLDEHIVHCLHDISQVNSIFIFRGNRQNHEQWPKKWSKVKGVYTDIELICDALKQSADDRKQNAISFSLVAAGAELSSINLERLDPMFMYTQIIKEIILAIKFEQKHLLDFTEYCGQVFKDDRTYSLDKVQMFEHDYYTKKAIWWYTSEAFLYSMLNRALRVFDIDIIVKIGFFIGDLHRQIEELHKEQYSDFNTEKQFTVYRGQGMSKEEFEKILRTKGGLIAFNNFLSTSGDELVSIGFAESVLSNLELLGVLFEMNIHPKKSTTPFASVATESAFGDSEDETLFAMHTVFRIKDIQSMDKNARLFRVTLELTSDKDQDLQVLTERIRHETFPDAKGWERLALVLQNLGKPKQAEEIYWILLEQGFDQSKMGYHYNNLGLCKQNQGKYDEAIPLYQKAIAILEKYYPNSLNLTKFYNNIGTVYSDIGKYAEAILSHKKALEIRQRSLPPNHPDLASSYNNIGSVYSNMGEYAKALSYYEKALAIKQSLPPIHPDLATSYGNIGNVYSNMGEYAKALSSHNNALEIRQRSLPPNHPDLASSYNNIGGVYSDMGEYAKALSSHKKALEIRRRSLSPNHPELALSYNNTGAIYSHMGKHTKALLYYERALGIQLQSRLPNHPDLATSYGNIANVYSNMGEYAKALSSHNNALEIRQRSLPPNHPDLASSYNNIGGVYSDMGEYAKALSSHNNALEIRQRSLSPNHPELALSYNNTGAIYSHMGKHTKALLYYERALAIRLQSRLPNHPDLVLSYNNIGLHYKNMKDYPKACSFYEKAMKIAEQSLPPDHPHRIICRNNLDRVKNKMQP